MSAVNINYNNFDCSWRAEKMKYFMMLTDHSLDIGIDYMLWTICYLMLL